MILYPKVGEKYYVDYVDISDDYLHDGIEMFEAMKGRTNIPITIVEVYPTKDDNYAPERVRVEFEEYKGNDVHTWWTAWRHFRPRTIDKRFLSKKLIQMYGG